MADYGYNEGLVLVYYSGCLDEDNALKYMSKCY